MESIETNSICGKCGTNLEDYNSGFCINGHDNWIEVQDLANPDLKDYVDDAISTLSVSKLEILNALSEQRSVKK